MWVCQWQFFYPVNTKFMLTIYQKKKVSDLNNGIIPFHDPHIPKYLQNI